MFAPFEARQRFGVHAESLRKISLRKVQSLAPRRDVPTESNRQGLASCCVYILLVHGQLILSIAYSTSMVAFNACPRQNVIR